jgi:hypothetical protein
MGEGQTLKLGFDLQFDDNGYVNQGCAAKRWMGLTPIRC